MEGRVSSGSDFDARVWSHPRLLERFFLLPFPERPRAVPRDLPGAVVPFVNREVELSWLDSLAEGAAAADGPLVVVLEGLPGVGKSATANTWARRNRARFPDGDVYCDYSGGATPSELVAGALVALGAAPDEVPARFSDRVAAYARRTAGLRVVVVVDDVSEPAQARVLYPSGAGSVVLVTSTRSLEELHSDGARLLRLEPLDDAAAARLLREMSGRARFDADADATATIVRACAGLPVALRVCGGRLEAHPRRSVAALATRVRDPDRRLSELSGSGPTSTAAVFDAAYSGLPSGAAEVYRTLGLLPYRDVAAGPVAAAGGLELGAARAGLDVLGLHSLLDERDDDSWTAHPLVREHARRLATAEPIRSEAGGLLGAVRWYAAALSTADFAVVSDRFRLYGPAPRPAGVPAMDGPAQAYAWFDSEVGNAVVSAREAQVGGWPTEVKRLAESFWPLCATTRRLTELSEVLSLGLGCARATGDAGGVARFASQLARVAAETGDPAVDVGALVVEAAAAADVFGDRILSASVTEFAGLCDLYGGRPDRAVATLLRSRAAFESLGYRRGVALQDYLLGRALVASGDPARGLRHLRVAVDESAAVADPVTVAKATTWVGEALAALGDGPGAAEAVGRALTAHGLLGNTFGRARCHETLARLVDGPAALAHTQEAYRLYEGLGHPRAVLIAGGLAADDVRV